MNTINDHDNTQQSGRRKARHQQPVAPASSLARLNRYLVSRTLLFLAEQDRQNLGRAFPRLFPQQQAQQQRGGAGRAHPQRQPRNTGRGAASGRGGRSSNAPGRSSSGGGPGAASTTTNIIPLVITDPHTLLARLNTRRLRKRLKYLKVHHQQSLENPETAAAADDLLECRDYVRNLTTEQIAVQEWQKLVKKPTSSDNKQEQPPLPSPYELLLFSPCPHPVTVLASYPRSGNSLLRNLFERTTLRVTGSDMRGNLLQHDLVGEAAVSTGMVQFVKTHYPERRGSPCFPARRAVLLVRNPYDAIESFFHLMMTSTHTSTIAEEVRREHQRIWEEMVLKEIQVWRDFHEYWLQRPNNIPLLVIRYEDLIRFTDKVAAKAVQFVLEIKDMRFFQRRIDQCIREEQLEQLGPYKPRSGGIGKSLEKYSPELLQQMNSMGIISTMEKLGYGEMLVPNRDEWELEPLDEYGVELSSRRLEDSNASEGSRTSPSVVAINAGKLVRGPERHTDWRRVRQALKCADDDGVAPAKCNCYRCNQAAR